MLRRASASPPITMLLLAASAWLVGCMGPAGMSGAEASEPTLRDKTMTVQRAKSSLVDGQTTKAETLATLGPAAVVKFDSGYEVWAYRGSQTRSRDAHAELVVLFTPAGVVQKSRICPAPAVVSP